MKRLFVVLFIICALPVFGALSVHSSREAQAFVALAGRSTAGGAYCTCGDPNCVYDPGECDQGMHSVTREQPQKGDGGGLLLIVFAVGFALRLMLRQ
jgi:hypothetical protein